MHVSLDGFVAGPNGEMDWILIEDDIFESAENRTKEADLALYGRRTYQLMDSYWPTAADQPNATWHDISHSKWYNSVRKVVVSSMLTASGAKNTTIINVNLPEEVRKLKSEEGKDIIMFGSPTLAHTLMEENLIDDFWLLINPILLGQGIPLFQSNKQHTNLKLVDSKVFASEVVCLHYKLKLP